jgi:hypothetical protein
VTGVTRFLAGYTLIGVRWSPAMTEAQLFALGLALAALSGIRAYLTVFGIGLAGYLGWLDLPPALHVASSPWVLATAGSLTLIEFFADKIPGVDSGWDLLQTLLRVPVGAFLAAAALSPDGGLGAGALVAGGAMALTTHIVKSATRVAVNASPEPFSNWTVSAIEDTLCLGGLSLAFSSPWLALCLVLAVVLATGAVAWWLLTRTLTGLRRLLGGGRATN